MIKNFIKNNKKLSILCAIIIIIFIILLLIKLNLKQNNDNMILKNFDYIIEIREDVESKCPYINLKGEEISEINDEILEKYTSALNNGYIINYKYNIYKNILSLILEENTNFYDTEQKKYYSYNINIDNMKILEEDELLEIFDIEKEHVIEKINTKFNNFYEEELSEGYLVSELCDYKCYKNIHDLNNFKYFIDINNKLNAYINYNYDTVYFNPEDYKKIDNSYVILN